MEKLGARRDRRCAHCGRLFSIGARWVCADCYNDYLGWCSTRARDEQDMEVEWEWRKTAEFRKLRRRER